MIVELKRSFGLPLVYQGIERQRLTDAVYLAVAAPDTRAARRAWDRGLGDMLGLCRRLGIGLISVGLRAEVLLDPAPYRPRKDSAQRKRLKRPFIAASICLMSMRWRTVARFIRWMVRRVTLTRFSTTTARISFGCGCGTRPTGQNTARLRM